MFTRGMAKYMSRKRIFLKIYGTVQGVFYRISSKKKAEDLGISGFVRNEEDGSVYIEAEGDETALKKFVEWCYIGPEGAKVNNIKIQDLAAENEKEFMVK